MWVVIRDAARSALRTVARGDEDAIERAAWWLQRAALDEADTALAVVALRETSSAAAAALESAAPS